MLGSLSVALAEVVEATLAPVIDPEQVKEAFRICFDYWSNEPLRLADFVA